MKYHKCEYIDCNHKATRKLKNGHMVCENCYRKLKHMHKVHNHNSFCKERRIMGINGYSLCDIVWIKYI